MNKQRGVVRDVDGSPIWLTGPWISELRTRLLRQKSEAKAKPRARPKGGGMCSTTTARFWLDKDVLKLLKEHLAGQT